MAMAEKKVDEQLVIAIPLYDKFTMLDAIGPYELLHVVPGFTVLFVSASANEPVTADSGMVQLSSTASFDDVQSPDIILVPGGPGTFAALNDTRLMSWVKKAHKETRYTTSVCTGAIVLAEAGLLQGLEATTHWAYYDDLRTRGACPIERRVVEQLPKRIITSAGVSSGIDMALYLIALLKGEEMAKAVQLVVEYDPQPPYDAGSPSKAGEAVVALAKKLLGLS